MKGIITKIIVPQCGAISFVVEFSQSWDEVSQHFVYIDGHNGSSHALGSMRDRYSFKP